MKVNPAPRKVTLTYNFPLLLGLASNFLSSPCWALVFMTGLVHVKFGRQHENDCNDSGGPKGPDIS